MTTSVRNTRFGDIAASPGFANSATSPTGHDISVPRRPALHPTLSSASSAGLAGIWRAEAPGGLPGLRRDSTDDHTPDSRRGSSSLLSTSESDGWSRRISQWSTATAPTARPYTATSAAARRASAFPSSSSSSASSSRIPHSSSTDSTAAQADLAFSLSSPYGAHAGHVPLSQPRQHEVPIDFEFPATAHSPTSARAPSYSLEPASLNASAWQSVGTAPLPSLHSQASPERTRPPGSRPDTANSYSTSSSRWNGQFEATLDSHTPAARPLARANTYQHSIAATGRQDLSQLNYDLGRLDLHSAPTDAVPNFRSGEGAAGLQRIFEPPGPRSTYSRDFVPDWSQLPQQAPHSGPHLFSGYPVPSNLDPRGSGRMTLRPGHHQALHQPQRPELNQYASTSDRSTAHDRVFADVPSQSENERVLAAWNARMYAQYGFDPYALTPPHANSFAATNASTPPAWPSAAMSPTAADFQERQQVSSSLLMDFHRSNAKGNQRYDLRDVFGHVCEFAGDQHGSRFIQQKLETANSDDKSRVFAELQPNAVQLMKDVFGNYVIQKFFEHGDQCQKKILAGYMHGQVLELSLNVYGCRVVQKALEHVLVDQQASMALELRDHVLRCVRDQNGNHVIQMAISKVPAPHITFIVDSIVGQVQSLATHTFGCRVVQRLLEHCEEPARSVLLRELHECAMTLICDQYGNYVTQHVIQYGKPQDRQMLIGLVKDHLIPFSKQKFASNVVEKSIVHGSDADRNAMISQFAQRDERGETALPFLLKDGYGNYVVQRLLDTLKDADYRRFVTLLEPEVQKARRSGPNKQVENVAKKMCRLDMSCSSSSRPPQAAPRPLAFESSGPTPPMTANGTPSPQSSSVHSSMGPLASPAGYRQPRKGSTPTIEVSAPDFP